MQNHDRQSELGCTIVISGKRIHEVVEAQLGYTITDELLPFVKYMIEHIDDFIVEMVDDYDGWKPNRCDDCFVCGSPTSTIDGGVSDPPRGHECQMCLKWVCDACVDTDKSSQWDAIICVACGRCMDMGIVDPSMIVRA